MGALIRAKVECACVHGAGKNPPLSNEPLSRSSRLALASPRGYNDEQIHDMWEH